MTTFDKREEAFEQKFAHDEDLRFKARARRDKLLGLWAAEKMGLEGDAAAAYAASVVMGDIEAAGAHDVVTRILADFAAAGVDQSEHRVRRQFEECTAAAMEQIAKGG